LVELGIAGGAAAIEHHHRKGFSVAVFLPPQALDCSVVAGITGQVVAAQALDGHGLSRQQSLCRRVQATAQARAAIVTGQRLRMEAAAGGVGVFPLAGGAQ